MNNFFDLYSSKYFTEPLNVLFNIIGEIHIEYMNYIDNLFNDDNKDLNEFDLYTLQKFKYD
jgi:hypothetical protein